MRATHYEVPIPSNESFLRQWHRWIHQNVSVHFKRDRGRMMDTVQNVRLRLLQKDFIGRWFFKHLKDELVIRSEAERMLGGAKLKFISQVKPVVGSRSEEDSLWRVSDLLEYAKFDHGRYYYSIQNHTIDSGTVLRLLGHREDDYGVLESLYRQGRLKPSELTEHECREAMEEAPDPRYDGDGNRLCSTPGCRKRHHSKGYCSQHYGKHFVSRCPACEKGRRLLRSRGISLANRWTDPEVRDAVKKLRWNDSQLRPFLRSWKRQNMICAIPASVHRPIMPSGKTCSVPGCQKKQFENGYCSQHYGIDAGLLKYARMIIDRAVVNDFKSMSRTYDVSFQVFNNGVSPEMSNEDTIALESDGASETPRQIFRDLSALSMFDDVETIGDLKALFERTDLTEIELSVISEIDLNDSSVKEFAKKYGMSAHEAQRIRVSALNKLRDASVGDSVIQDAARRACDAHGCSIDEMMGDVRFGKCVLARTEFLTELTSLGLSVSEIAARTSLSESRITLSLSRGDLT